MHIRSLCYLLLMLCVTSCDDKSSNPEQPTPIAPATPSVAPSPSASPHNYDLREGSNYAYIAAISEDQRKAGKAAGDVLMFRYLGKANGLHTVALLNDAGTVVDTSVCAEPCVIIKHQNGSRTAYNPNAVLGAVFEDAINGHLEVTSGNPSHSIETVADVSASQVPSAFRGEWDGGPSPCQTDPSDTRLRIGARKLEFYESDAEVKSVRSTSSRAVTIRTVSTGEGETWDSEMELVLSRSGNELTIRSEGFESTRNRCR